MQKLKTITRILVLVFSIPSFLLSQPFTNRHFSGLYKGSLHDERRSSADDGVRDCSGPAPSVYYKLNIKSWGRFVLREKHNPLSQTSKCEKYIGSWKVEGDSMFLKFDRSLKTKQVYHLQFLNQQQCPYRFQLTRNRISLLKVRKIDS